ncbi:hypothetical protein SAMN06265375_103127 [Muriicola jejuensis]|uniref:DUF7467 domain-containing protein n=1 Tax=Muriicola jejuensis TaxID=504488 RepID=A0A6P0UI34_9FLAO|nr:thioester domain-containing protein [Muriicola jejuensis]NER11508.1 hypothetical protein [Muriicola jejuensis]SMP20254.1 hypothetical protein SAMN06265375_103127 [Muriicola jejuensis]
MKKLLASLTVVLLVVAGCSDVDLLQDENLLKSVNFTGTTTECYPDIDGLVSGLPTSVEVTTTAKPGMDSYFTININDSDLAGENIPAWCIDVDRSLGVDHTFVADVYSSTESLPDLFENPENFDLINWIINQQYIGKPSPSGGNYTFGDVQWAIWELIDDVNCVACAFLGDGWSVTKGQEIVDAALASPEAEGFVPDCGQLIAIVLIPQDNSQPIFITLEVPCDCKETECNECDGKVTRLDLQYNGENPADIVVMDKKGDNELPIGIINPGETFTVDGSTGIFDDKKNTLGTEIVIFVDGVENTKIHTSCSQPIGPGLTFGDFTVVGGASRNGGELCPLDPPPGNGDDCGECDGKVTRLDLVNDGPATQIVVTDKKGENEIFNEFVEAGATFTLSGFDKNGTLGTEIVIKANGSETKIHTSCSQPIGPGLSFGDFTVVGGASRNGGELCPLDPPPGNGGDDDCECDGKVDYLKLSYSGDLDDDIRVETKKEGDVFNGKVSADGTFEFYGNDKKGTLGTEITIYVNGEEAVKIHTSCSQPIGPGLVAGDFEVIEGTSRNGGDLCPL